MSKTVVTEHGYTKLKLEFKDLVGMTDDISVEVTEDIDAVGLTGRCKEKLDDTAGAGINFGEFV